MNALTVHQRRKLLDRRNLRGSPGEPHERLRDRTGLTLVHNAQSPICRSAIRHYPEPDDFPPIVCLAMWFGFALGGVGVAWIAIRAVMFIWGCARGAC